MASDDDLVVLIQSRLKELFRNMPDSDEFFPNLGKARLAFDTNLFQVTHGIADAVRVYYELAEQERDQLRAEVERLKQENETVLVAGGDVQAVARSQYKQRSELAAENARLRSVIAAKDAALERIAYNIFIGDEWRKIAREARELK